MNTNHYNNRSRNTRENRGFNQYSTNSVNYEYTSQPNISLDNNISNSSDQNQSTSSIPSHSQSEGLIYSHQTTSNFERQLNGNHQQQHNIIRGEVPNWPWLQQHHQQFSQPHYSVPLPTTSPYPILPIPSMHIYDQSHSTLNPSFTNNSVIPSIPPPPPPPPPLPPDIRTPPLPFNAPLATSSTNKAIQNNNPHNKLPNKKSSTSQAIQRVSSPIKNAMADLSSLRWSKGTTTAPNTSMNTNKGKRNNVSTSKKKKKKRKKQNKVESIEQPRKADEMDHNSVNLSLINSNNMAFVSSSLITNSNKDLPIGDPLTFSIQQYNYPNNSLENVITTAADVQQNTSELPSSHVDKPTRNPCLTTSYEQDEYMEESDSNHFVNENYHFDNNVDEEMDISDDEACNDDKGVQNTIITELTSSSTKLETNSQIPTGSQNLESTSNNSVTNISNSTTNKAKSLAEKKLKLEMALNKVALEKAKAKLLLAQRKKEKVLKVNKKNDITAYKMKSLLVKVAKTSLIGHERTASNHVSTSSTTSSTSYVQESYRENASGTLQEEKQPLNEAEKLKFNLELARRKLKLKALLNEKAKKEIETSASDESMSKTSIETFDIVASATLDPSLKIVDRKDTVAELRKKQMALRETIENSMEMNKGLKDGKEIRELKQLIEKQRHLLQSHSTKISTCNQNLQQCTDEIDELKELKLKSIAQCERLMKRKAVMEKMISSVSKKIFDARRRRQRVEETSEQDLKSNRC